ncbi:hypothetical protein LTR66_005072 [Elasticomyces elasticus]|nr:hypothetical protein LTR66_005072 [Elasticomyces elasticus]KAK5006938.1 hypothetical protein LTR28_005877 [Elasticomyces elasticus]
MGVIRTLVAFTGYSGLATVGAFTIFTRRSKFVPLSPTDYIFNNTFFARYNPDTNPTMNDLCVRTVPLTQIRPELLEKEERLVEAFCAGVWGGLGYAFQRRYLERKYRGANTSHQLWDAPALKSSNYPIGTQITDHFEVLSHTPNSIIVRCGDSPMKKDVRASDGLFEMAAFVREEEGVAEFQLKSCFYQGLGKVEGSTRPMPAWMEWAHRQYTKLWMESAVRNVMR